MKNSSGADWKAPNSKPQHPEKHPSPNFKEISATLWSLKRGISLELGAWNLELDSVTVHTMKVGKLLHTRYRVDDLERTVKFYRDVLGLEETKRHKSPRGSELVFLKAPGSSEEIEICFFPGSEPVNVQPDLTHLAFEVDSLEEFAKHLTKLGVKF